MALAYLWFGIAFSVLIGIGLHRLLSNVVIRANLHIELGLNNSSRPPFIYKPLTSGQIRLLHISKKWGNVFFKLFHADLVSAPKYLALSYVWGGTDPDQDLIVNGAILKTTYVKILLPYIVPLLEKYGTQNMWIDGICINQKDKAERACQVQLMEKIYSQTAAGIIWLGESDSFTEMAMLMIPDLARKLKLYDSRLGFNRLSFAAHDLPSTSSPVWAGVDYLFAKPWFTRVWTFQEAVLPRNIEFVCGSLAIDFNSLWVFSAYMLTVSKSESMESATESVDWKRKRAQEGWSRILAIEELRRHRASQPDTPYPLLNLFRTSWSWAASVHSDKIYGLLGLAEQSLRDQVLVDYGNSTEEVYRDFARCWISNAGNCRLELLHMTPSNLDERLPGLPTWCPNFGRRPLATPLGLYASAAGYSAGIDEARRHKTLTVSDDSRKLQLEGFRVDKIKDVLRCPWERQQHKTVESKDAGIAEVLKWETDCLKISMGAYESPDGVPDAHCRTLIANKHANTRLYSGDIRETYHLTRLVISRLTTADIPLLPAERDLAVKPLSAAQQLQVQDYGAAFGYASHGRSFFSTENRRIGLGPQHADVGDEICIFYNGYTPFVFRPENKDGKIGMLIGECYVDGIMYGEVLVNHEREVDTIYTLE